MNAASRPVSWRLAALTAHAAVNAAHARPRRRRPALTRAAALNARRYPVGAPPNACARRAEPRGARLQVAPLRDAERAARRELVVGARRVRVARELEQVRADGAGQRRVVLRRGQLLQPRPRAVD